MSSSVLQALVIGAVSGAVAAAGTVVVLSGEGGADEPTQVAQPNVVATPSSGVGEEAFEDLRTELAMMGQRLAELESRPAPQPVRQALPSETVIAEAEDVKALVAALSDPSQPVPPALADSIRQVLDDREAEEDREREERREEWLAAEMDARMERYTTELGLDRYQQDEMRVILTNERARRDELRDEIRETGDFMSMRESMDLLRSETMEELGGILNAEQMEQYQDMGRGRGGFGGGPGGPGGPGGDGGGGGRGGRGF